MVDQGNRGVADDLFGVHEGVFERRRLLETGYVPRSDRIVGRDEELRRLGSALAPAVTGDPPNNVLVYGKAGTGKSLCVKHATRRCQEAAAERGVRVGRAVVDCSQQDTETRAIRAVARQLNDADATGVTVPETGLGRSRYYDRLWTVLDARYDVALVVLDEVDRLADTEFLLQLSRAEEAGKLDRCRVGVLGVSNESDFRERIPAPVRSTLQEREIVFAPYSTDVLTSILEGRADAISDDALGPDVLGECATLAAREHGDARRAIALLRHAGEVALEYGDGEITVAYVREAHERAERDRIRELVAGATVQQKAVLLALSTLAVVERERTFRTTDVFDLYEQICTDAGLSALSRRRVHDLLREWESLRLLEITHTGDGRGQGSFLEHHLLEDPAIIRTVLEQDSRFAGLSITVSGDSKTCTWSEI
ncbi:MAG: Cdc6/Cdc18 family protein [Haloarculaceae archaeon]